MDLTGAGSPERLQGLRVSAEIFPVLGVSPVIGRGFTQAEDHPDSGVAVISYRLWQGRFGGDPGVVGRVVDFDRKPTTIVGVLPKDFEFPLPGLPFGGGHDVWVPLGITPEERAVIGNYNFDVIARLKPGVKMAQAQGRCASDRAAHLRGAAGSGTSGVHARRAGLASSGASRARFAQAAVAAGGCGWVRFVNRLRECRQPAAGRAAGRERELAIRSSLGASRARLLRQLFTESLLLSISGGAAGLLLATWLVALLARVIPASVPRAATIDLDWHVVAFTAVVSVLAGLLFGAMPALTAAPNRRVGSIERCLP